MVPPVMSVSYLSPQGIESNSWLACYVYVVLVGETLNSNTVLSVPLHPCKNTNQQIVGAQSDTILGGNL